MEQAALQEVALEGVPLAALEVALLLAVLQAEVQGEGQLEAPGELEGRQVVELEEAQPEEPVVATGQEDLRVVALVVVQ